jgi:hypothetical protein
MLCEDVVLASEGETRTQGSPAYRRLSYRWTHFKRDVTYTCQNSGFHGVEYEGDSFLGCGAV